MTWRDRKFAKATSSRADGLILDLKDAGAPANKRAARDAVAALVTDQAQRDSRFFVQVNPFDTGLTFDDVAAVVRPGLDGLVLPKANGAAELSGSPPNSMGWRPTRAWRPARSGSSSSRPRQRRSCSTWAATRRRIPASPR